MATEQESATAVDDSVDNQIKNGVRQNLLAHHIGNASDTSMQGNANNLIVSTGSSSTPRTDRNERSAPNSTSFDYNDVSLDAALPERSSYMLPGEGHEQQEGRLEDNSMSNLQVEEDDQEGKDKEAIREQDRFLPIANVNRIMKAALPKVGKIAKDAKECVQECVSEFVSFITSEFYRASDRCQQEKRKTINGEDILFAMSSLGFDNYIEPLKMYLTKYREAMKGDKGPMNISHGKGDANDDLDDSTVQPEHQSYQVTNAHLHSGLIAAPPGQNDQANPSNIYSSHFSGQMPSGISYN
ncbi:Nuclear transcription factor Y subunit beta [Trichoplax sp. H2]|nr:Nuclear transcription factor Y subunit beta [Trichoplax sp. H2]|eukprot:RDD42099.1 Nuclear transcription factor Y subunit beta [Trichoplax sp. H2]